MPYLLLAFILCCLAFAFSFIASIVKKRFAFVSLVLSYIGGNVCMMYKFDIVYLMDLVGEIENFLMILFLSSIGILAISVAESLLMKNKRHPKKNEDKEVLYYEKDTKLYYFNMLDEDIAYYNFDKKKYVLNNAFRRRLNLKEIEISEDELRVLVAYEDVNAFNSKEKNIKFKLQTDEKMEWYERKIDTIGSDEYIIIHKIDNKLGKDAVVLTYKDLDKALKEKERNGEKFGLILSNISSIKEYTVKSFTNLNNEKDIKDKELRDIVLIKYLTKLLNGNYKDIIKIYKISSYEYAFLFELKDIYLQVERSVMNNASEFLEDDIEISGKTYKVRAKLACVLSDYVKIREDYHVINAAFDLLQTVVSSTYKQNYGILKKEYEDDNNIDLKEMGIDLANDIKKYINRNE
ncbi:MAG: hypothetical protein K6E74_02625 [Bacilli bacterium]|nr:hypothetical protein [Bacilli bacterium]